MTVQKDNALKKQLPTPIFGAKKQLTTPIIGAKKQLPTPIIGVKRLLWALLIAICLLAGLTGDVTAEAAIRRYRTDDSFYYDYVDDHIIISDGAGLFTSSEIDRLKRTMESINGYAGVALVTVDYNSMGSAERLAAELNESFTSGDTQESVLILIDMDNRYVIIDTLGESAPDTITHNVADTITDNCYKDLGNGNYYKAADKMLSQILAKFEGRKFSEPVKYISLALMSLAIGMFFSYAIAKWKYLIKRSGTPGTVFRSIWNKNSRIDPKKDAVWFPNVIYKTTKKTYSPASSGGGGGGGHGGGGHSGGGHSSGGHGF